MRVPYPVQVDGGEILMEFIGDGATAAPVVPSPDVPLDCCDGGTCACSCLHHAPVVVISAAPWAVSPYRWVAQLGRLVSVPAAPSAPAIRPPIA